MKYVMMQMIMWHQQSIAKRTTELAVTAKRMTASAAVVDIFNHFYSFGQNNPLTGFI
jgi:hypothetical protein